MKKIINSFKIACMALVSIMILSCDGDEACDYPEGSNLDCPLLMGNIGDICDSNNNGNLDGIIDANCACVPIMPLPNACSGFIGNGGFEDIDPNEDPNTVIDNDINIATSWGPLWASGSLADLFDENTTNFGSSSFVAPTPPNGAFAGMWIENSNSSSPSWREGMFNTLTSNILPNTGKYRMFFDYAVMGDSSGNPVKVAVYGVNFNGILPPNPTAMQVPTNLNLYGAGNTVLIGEIIVPTGATNVYSRVNLPFDTATLTMPAAGFSHFMITSSHLPLPNFGRMYIAFDEYCLVQEE